MPSEWKSFPLYVYKTDLDAVVLPTSRDFQSMAEQRRKIELTIEEVEETIAKLKAISDDDGTIAREKRVVELESKIRENRLLLVEYDVRKDRLERAFREKEADAILHEYELAYPTFDEYLKADQDAKDWVDERPVLNQGRFARGMLAGHVKINGSILTQREVDQLPNYIANALWAEMQAMIFPNYERIPFM